MQTVFRTVSWVMLVLLALVAMSGAASAQDVVSISGVVSTRADGLSVPGAVVSAVGSDVIATADGHGRYTLTVPRSLRAAAACRSRSTRSACRRSWSTSRWTRRPSR